MGLEKLLRQSADRVSNWENMGTSAKYRKRVQVKTMADLRALGDEFGQGGPVRYSVSGVRKTLDEIAEMADVQLSEVAVMAFPRGSAAGDEDPYTLPFTITRDGRVPVWPRKNYMTVSVPDPSTSHLAMPLDRAKAIAESCVQVCGPFTRRNTYPVVKTITNSTAQQRVHDRKIRWQSAGLSFLVSSVVGVLTVIVTIAFGG